MASIATRIMASLGDIKISRLIMPTVIVVVLVLVVRWATAPPKPLGAVMEKIDKEHLFEVLDDSEIQARLAAMTDTRPDSCQYAEYDAHSDKVTILLDFHEHQFYNLKMTLESILKFTPDELYHEIVLLDDGTGTDRVRLDAHTYLQQPRFHKLKAYRSDNADGPALTRFKASKVSTGTILVFLHSEVAVNHGWLPPLINAIRSDRHTVAVPHFDSLLSGNRFFRTPENLINIFTWTLSTLYTESSEGGQFLKTPVMTGEAFAVDKEFFDSIGNFDEGITHGSGEALEFSMRTWMCGGSIKIVSCSRVAVKNALEPHKISNAKNIRRIAELWLEHYKTLAFKQTAVSADMDENEIQSFRTRKMYLKKQVSCVPFGDYLSNHVPQLREPPRDARFFGKLKSKTGYCVKHSANADATFISMVHCKPHMYETDMLVAFDSKGRVKTESHCLDLLSETEVKWVPCDQRRNEQLWILTGDGLFKNAVHTKLCLKHESGNDKHRLGVAACLEGERTLSWEFIKY